MTKKGLNNAQRAMTRALIRKGYDGEYVRGEVRHMVDQTFHSNEGQWDYDKNVSLCAELASEGYQETAKFLEGLINDRSV